MDERTLAGLYKKLLSAQRAIDKVDKDSSNDFHHYKYASAEGVSQATRGILHDVGLIIIPTMLNQSTVNYDKIDKKTGQLVGVKHLTTVEYEYRIIDTETGAFVTAVFAGHGEDESDKSIAKAMTMCHKYARLGILDLGSGDDPEKTDKKKSTGTTTKKSSGGQTGKKFPSKFGTEAEPNKCGFCGTSHIIKGEMLTYVDKVCGAVDCANATAPPKVKVSDMNRAELITKIEDGEKILGGKDLRAGHPEGGLDLQNWKQEDLINYLKQIAKNVKK